MVAVNKFDGVTRKDAFEATRGLYVEFDQEHFAEDGGVALVASKQSVFDNDSWNETIWEGKVFVYAPSPQYRTEEALHRLKKHGNGIILLPAAIHTRAWKRNIWNDASGILFLENGITSSHGKNQPYALVAYGEEAAQDLAESEVPGAVVTQWATDYEG